MTSTRLHAALIFLFGLLLFTIGLSKQEVIGFESRFYLFALEMWRHGPNWFATTYHMPYPDYPGTGTFLIYLIAKCVGGLNKWVAVFPSACAAAITLSVTYLIGALHSRLWGWSAVGFLLFTVAFMMEARTISLDQFITAITTGCFYLVYSAKVLQKPARIKWIFILFILGFALRGPLGLVIPTGVVCLFYLLEKEVKKFMTIGVIATVLLILCGAILLGLAYHVGGADFLHNVLQMQVLGRMQEMRTPPVSFYFIESLGAYAIAYPVAIFVLLGLVFRFSSSAETKLLLKCFAWVAVIMIGLSIPADKKVRYILPIAPALALICGYLYIVAKEQRYFKAIRIGLYAVCMVLPITALGTLWFLHCDCPELRTCFMVSAALLVMAQLVMFFWWRSVITVFFAAVVTFIIAMVAIVEPVNNYFNHARSFVLKIEKIREQQRGDLVFYREGRDGLVIKYLVNMPKESDPIFFNDIAQLQQLKSSAVVVTKAENYEKIPKNIANQFSIIAKEKMGRENMVVFSKTVFHPPGAS